MSRVDITVAAITESAATDSIVTVPAAEADRDWLLAVCDGNGRYSTEWGTVAEYWGVEGGSNWCVHVVG